MLNKKNNLKKIFILISSVLLFGVYSISLAAPAPSDDFVITVKTDNTGTSSNTEFTIPTTGAGYSYDVDCNDDGTNEATGQTGNYTCNYGATGLNTGAGTYTVRIKGTFPRIFFNNGGDKDKILTIEQWGTGSWTSMAGAFYGCSNLDVTASDTPVLSGVTEMQNMFRIATSLSNSNNNSIGTWDVSHVTNLNSVFRGTTSFSISLNNWVTSSATTMARMFSYSSFNGDIHSWNTSNVTNMEGMFFHNPAFNQDIGGWVTSSVTTMANMFANSVSVFNQNIGSWSTGSVTTMEGMFWDNTHFNQDIHNWDTSNVTNMDDMFHGATAFEQNLGSWLITSLTDADSMFAGVHLDTQNYDALLTGWYGQQPNIQNAVTFDGGNSYYCQADTDRSALISGPYNWVISDSLQSCAPIIEGGATDSINVDENTTVVETVHAVPAVSGDTITYSITNGVDEGKFNIDATSGALTFATAPNYESPTDANADNVYEVEVTATDSDNTTTDVQTITVTVNNVNDRPVATWTVIHVNENQTAIANMSGMVSDEDSPAQTLTHSCQQLTNVY